jgi:hypothetical protein
MVGFSVGIAGRLYIFAVIMLLEAKASLSLTRGAAWWGIIRGGK